MKKKVIVSLADANYYPLLDELVNSIKSYEESSDVAICILDAGLTDQQKDRCFSLDDNFFKRISGKLTYQQKRSYYK